MSVKIIDGFVVSPIESLKAEWLYSQGKGRSFRVGDQHQLAQYLSQSCPLSGEALENENERKLRLILSKAQQHQRQLHEQTMSGGGSPATTPNNSSTNNSPSSNRRKGPSRIQSPRGKRRLHFLMENLKNSFLVSRLSSHHRPATADAVMSSSFHGTSMTTSHVEPHNHQLLEMTKSLIENFTSDNLMTQSLDPTILASAGSNSFMNSSMTSSVREPHPSLPLKNGNLYNDQSCIPIVYSSGPLVTASKMMPVPESLMSPDCGPPPITQQRPISALTASTTNYTTSSSVRSARLNQQQQQRPQSSPAASNKSPRALKKPEKSSPSNSPRKTIANTTNTKIHQNQSILKQSGQHRHQTRANDVETTLSSVATTEDEDEDDVNVEKLRSIRKTAQKSQKQLENNHQQIQKAVESKEVEKSAIAIQKLWRGYSTRKKTMKDIAENLQQKRTQDYIVKLTADMEMTKHALENERKIQQLQMQAINALWKKVSNMQTIPEGSTAVENVAGLGGQDLVQDLTKTCSMLTNQVNFNLLLPFKS